jgi:hypothetical protein
MWQVFDNLSLTGQWQKKKKKKKRLTVPGTA